MNLQKYKSQRNFMIYVLVSGIITLMISQIPSLNHIAFFKLISYAIWLVVLVWYLIVEKAAIHNSLMTVFLLVIPLYTYSLLINPIFSKELFFFRELNIVLLMILIGSFIAQVSPGIIKPLLITYVFSVAVVLLDAYVNYLQGNMFSSQTYLYPFKNSLGAMIVNSIIILIFGLKTKKRFWIYFNYFVVILFFFALLGIQNRSGILVLLVIILLSGIIKWKNTLKYAPLIFIIVSLVLLIWGERIVFIVNRALLVDSYLSGGLEMWSSSRLDDYIFAYNEFKLNPILGSNLTLMNDVYIESFYLQYFSSYGLLGLSVLLLFIIPIFILLKISNLKYGERNLYMLVWFLTLAMFLVAIAEQSAPFGPGAVYFLSWLLIGYSISFKRNRNGVE